MVPEILECVLGLKDQHSIPYKAIKDEGIILRETDFLLEMSCAKRLLLEDTYQVYITVLT